MSALGQRQTWQSVSAMSALPPKADIGTQSRDVRFVPKADIQEFATCIRLNPITARQIAGCIMPPDGIRRNRVG